MDAFFGITLSVLVLYIWWRSASRKPGTRELRRNTVYARWEKKRLKAEKAKQDIKLARKPAKESRKNEDTELISVIIPIINQDK